MTVANTTFNDLITFTRASTGTFVGSNGLVQSAAINTPRFDYNPSTLAAQGLLIEEARTNLVTYSEQFNNAAWTKTGSSITANAITAPDGALTADRLVENTANSTHVMSQSFSATTGTAVTLSVYVKSTERFAVLTFGPNATFGGTGATGFFNISSGIVQNATGPVTALITAAGNGWYRCSITSTPTATGTATASIGLSLTGGAQTYTGDGTSGLHFWGAQLEASTFPSSYIPTTTAAVTRAADVAAINTLSPWFNATEGTLYAKYTTFNVSQVNGTVALSDGTNNNRMVIRAANASAQTVFIGVDATVTTWSGIINSALANTVTNTAFAYKLNDIAWARNGGTVGTDSSASIPVVNQLKLGADGGGTFPLNGYLQRITYYPQRLTNSELQALTA